MSLALVRLLELVGEAAARVAGEERARYEGLPWAEVIGMRNRLIHGYDAIDFDVVWRIVREDLPDLIDALEGVVETGDEPRA